ncbi:hypothetical protein O181_060562 [Austropuccinia psidii MF-1]|uniref:Uncharacterized protein n=1 Tax=Austropuccinia psidii MF-1 TaxID=1389203 RepID=A0A9Q3ENT3_9BASI|nr:hypothetical protein [Austropuccinia psidii MF-1]
MITSDYSLNHSTSRRQGRKPTAQLEAWKKDHSQYESCSYDSLFLRPTANRHSRSPRKTKEINFKSFRHKSSQDNITTNTVFDNKSGNTPFKNSSNTAYQIPFNPLLHTYDNNKQSHSLYNAGPPQATSVLKSIGNFIQTKKIISKEEYSSNDEIDEDPNSKSTTDSSESKRIGSSRISNCFDKDIDAKSNENTINSKNSSSTICDLNTGHNSSSLPAKIEDKQENNIADASKIQNEIQRFIPMRTIGKSTPLKETISKPLKTITTNIDSAINIDKLFFPNEDYNKLNTSFEEIKKCEESFYFEFPNEPEIQICNNFYDSDYTTRKQLYFNNSKTQNIIIKIGNKYSCYY